MQPQAAESDAGYAGEPGGNLDPLYGQIGPRRIANGDAANQRPIHTPPAQLPARGQMQRLHLVQNQPVGQFHPPDPHPGQRGDNQRGGSAGDDGPEPATRPKLVTVWHVGGISLGHGPVLRERRVKGNAG